MERKNYGMCGAYFLTVCVKERYELLGEISNGKILLSDVGAFAENELYKVESIYPSVVMDTFIIMPNHVHMLVFLLNSDLNPSVSRIIQQWKGAVSKQAGFSLNFMIT